MILKKNSEVGVFANYKHNPIFSDKNPFLV